MAMRSGTLHLPKIFALGAGNEAAAASSGDADGGGGGLGQLDPHMIDPDFRSSRPTNRKGLVINANRQSANQWGNDGGALSNVDAVAVQDTFTWADMEPQPGAYDFSALEQALDDCDEAGKRLVPLLSFSGATASVNYCPTWALDQTDGSYTVHNAAGTALRFPITWRDPVLSQIKTFIAALANRYNGDRRIEYLRVGGWQAGTNEPVINDAGTFTDLKDVLSLLGIPFEDDPSTSTALDGTDEYSVSVLETGGLLETWNTQFSRSVVAATIKFVLGNDSNNGWYQALIDKCLALDLHMLQTGFNEGDKSDVRADALEWRAAGARFGGGGTSGVGNHSSLTGEALQLEVALQAVGDDGAYAPRSRLTHFTLNQATKANNALAFPSALAVYHMGLEA